MKIRVSMQSFMDACMKWRLGVISAEKALLGEVTLSDYNEYLGTLDWENPNGICTTDRKGNILFLELEV